MDIRYVLVALFALGAAFCFGTVAGAMRPELFVQSKDGIPILQYQCGRAKVR